MYHKLTDEEFKKRLSIINPDIVPLESYENSHTHIMCTCNVCKANWKATPSNLLRGYGCPECGKIKCANSRRKTLSEFVEELSTINSDIVVLGDYKTTDTKIKCRCKKCGNEWNPRPADLLKGKGCPECSKKKRSDSNPRKKTNDQFISELRSINSNIQILGNYINSKTPVECKCLICGYIWNASPCNLLSGKGCPKCAHRVQLSQEQFVEQVGKVNAGIEIVGEYRTKRTHVECKCKKCQYEWKAVPELLLKGSGCPKCAGVLKKTQDQFVEEVKTVNPSIDVIGTYRNSNTPVRCRCHNCGNVWNPLPSTIMGGGGCPECGKKISIAKRTKSKQQFIAELDKFNPMYEVLGEYKNNSSPIKCRCKICGNEWNPRPTTLLRGGGCPKCASAHSALVRLKDSKTFLEELASINGNISVLDEYKGNKTRLTCKCSVCGNEWKALPINLLRGNGCPSCSKSSTSFMEQYIYESMKRALGNEAVFSRDKSAVGIELDIYLPAFRIAIEPGTWFFHSKRLWHDEQKADICRENGIKLYILYTEYDEQNSNLHFENCVTTPLKVDASRNTEFLQEYVSYLLAELGIKKAFSKKEWAEIYKNSCQHARRKTTEKFAAELEINNPNVILLGEYINNRTKTEIKCKKCSYVWKATPANLLRGYGCPNCAGMTRTTESFKDEIKKVNDTVDVIGEYKSNKSKIECKCKKCGHIWDANPNVLLRGGGCPKCAIKQRTLSKEEFVKRVKMKNENVEVIGEYINSKSNIKCQCKICGHIWEKKACNILYSAKCPNCN